MPTFESSACSRAQSCRPSSARSPARAMCRRASRSRRCCARTTAAGSWSPGSAGRSDLDPERLRVAAALAANAARPVRGRSIAWAAPGERRRRRRAMPPAPRRGHDPGRLPVRPLPLEPNRTTRAHGSSASSSRSAGEDVAAEVEAARVAAEAANRARELQSLPANELRPESLAERAREIADANDAISVEVLDREQMVERGMGGLVAVSAGSDTPPRLIALRYEGGGSSGRDRPRRQGRSRSTPAASRSSRPRACRR